MKGAVPARIAADSLADEVATVLGASSALDPALLDAAFRAWSANTLRAFRSDLLLWGRWCHRRRIEPGEAQPGDVGRWIRELAAGDVVLLAGGGHGFEVLEEIEMIEVKQGPYAGDKDKTRFAGITADQVRWGNRDDSGQ